MSDLDRFLPKQPTAVPILGSETETYTAPGEDWDGELVRVALDSGEEEAGLTPNTRITPEVLNDLIGRLGEGLASVIDSPALTWSTPFKTFGDDPAFEGMGNGLFSGPIVSPGLIYGLPEFLCATSIAGFWKSFDGRTWVGGVDVGFATVPDAMTAGVNVAGDEIHIVIFSKEVGEAEVDQFRTSSNGGATFVDGGQLPAAANTADKCVMAWFASQPYLFTTLQAYINDTPTSDVEWTEIDVNALWGPSATEVSCAAVSPTEMLVGFDGGKSISRTGDGVTFTINNTGLPASANVAHIVWSTSHELWILRLTDGSLYTAPAGVSAWSERTAPSYGGVDFIAPHAIGVLGRTVVVADSNFLWASRDLERWARLIPIGDATSSIDNWEFILPFNGCLWAAHRAPKSDGTGVTFEATMSGVLAPELVKIAGF